MKRSNLPKMIAALFIIICLFATVFCGCRPQQTSTCAIQAFLSEPYPLKVLAAQGVSVYVRVERQDVTIWRESVTVSESDITADNNGETYHLSAPTALGALDEASNHEPRFPYYVTDEYGGLYVKSIDGEEPSGMCGWMYRVDYYSPSVGAGQFILNDTTPPEHPHREVLWYYGTWGEVPLKISLSDTEADVNEEFIATVSQYSDDTHDWSPCEGAAVHINHHNYRTGAHGTVEINIDSEGTFDIFAEKDGCIRSDRKEVTVTAPVPATCTLTIEVNGNGSTMPPAGSRSYDAGTMVDISATPDEGWQFDSWAGDVANSSSSTTVVTMDEDKMITANFIEIPSAICTLTVTCEPGEGGSIALSPTAEGNQYEAGTSVELTATPAEGYTFANWNGDLSDNINLVSITMDCDKNITANFMLPAPEKPANFPTSHGSQTSGSGLDTGTKIAIVVIIVLVAALVFVFRRIKRGA